MSGEHFDCDVSGSYQYFRITEFAEKLKIEIEANDDKTENEHGEQRGYGFEEETIERLIEAQKAIEFAGKLMEEIEFLYSFDRGEEDFNKLFDEIWEEVYEHGWRTL